MLKPGRRVPLPFVRAEGYMYYEQGHAAASPSYGQPQGVALPQMPGGPPQSPFAGGYAQQRSASEYGGAPLNHLPPPPPPGAWGNAPPPPAPFGGYASAGVASSQLPMRHSTPNMPEQGWAASPTGSQGSMVPPIQVSDSGNGDVSFLRDCVLGVLCGDVWACFLMDDLRARVGARCPGPCLGTLMSITPLVSDARICCFRALQPYGNARGITKPQSRFGRSQTAGGIEHNVRAFSMPGFPQQLSPTGEPVRMSLSGMAIRKSITGTFENLENGAWLNRIKTLGRLLVVVFFANMLWQECEEWRYLKGQHLNLVELSSFSPHGIIEALMIHGFPVDLMSFMLPALTLLLLGVATPICAAILAGMLATQVYAHRSDFM